MRRTIACGVAIALLGAVTASPHGARAGECSAGEAVSISATVLRAFANKGGKTTLDIRSATPCDINWIEIDVPRPPSECKYEATITATGKLDDLFGQMLLADSFECE